MEKLDEFAGFLRDALFFVNLISNVRVDDITY